VKPYGYFAFYHLIFIESGCHDGPFAGEIL